MGFLPRIKLDKCQLCLFWSEICPSGQKDETWGCKCHEWTSICRLCCVALCCFIVRWPHVKPYICFYWSHFLVDLLWSLKYSAHPTVSEGFFTLKPCFCCYNFWCCGYIWSLLEHWDFMILFNILITVFMIIISVLFDLISFLHGNCPLTKMTVFVFISS